MNIAIREFKKEDVCQMREIWNEVVSQAAAFPQEEPLSEKSAFEFFSAQSYTAVAENVSDGRIVGLYILHPNNIGRCGHISNASYAVKSGLRGMHIGHLLVSDCLKNAKRLGFKILQFNAVVKSNASAHALYKDLGFVELGTVPGGFRHNDGSFEDIVLYYHTL